MKRIIAVFIVFVVLGLTGCASVPGRILSLTPPDSYYEGVMKELEDYSGILIVGYLEIKCVNSDKEWHRIKRELKAKPSAIAFHHIATGKSIVYLSRDYCWEKPIIRHEIMHFVVNRWSDRHKSEFIAECVENYWSWMLPRHFKIPDDY